MARTEMNGIGGGEELKTTPPALTLTLTPNPTHKQPLTHPHLLTHHQPTNIPTKKDTTKHTH